MLIVTADLEIPLKVIRLTVLLTLATFAAGVSNAFSQEAHGYVQLAGIRSTTAGSGSPEGAGPTSAVSALGGTAFGFAVEAGFFVSHRVSVGFEASVPGRFDGNQIEGEFPLLQVESRHRDVLLSGIVRVNFPVAESVSIGVETGPTFVKEDTVFRTAPQILPPFAPVTFGPLGPESTLTRQTGGVLAGADTRVRVAGHLDFVAQLRVYWVSRDDNVLSNVQGVGLIPAVRGLGPWIVQPALGVRFTF